MIEKLGIASLKNILIIHLCKKAKISMRHNNFDQFLVGHTFLSDSELEWTPLMSELPNAPDNTFMCANKLPFRLNALHCTGANMSHE